MLAAAIIAAPARACEEHANVRAVLDPLPSVLSDMRIELHTTMGPQIVIENRTQRTVEILDDTDSSFVRIGPNGVEANLAAASWYRTYSPGAQVPASAGDGLPPRWVWAASQPSFGWFEPRLDPKGVPLPAEVISAAQVVELARWTVPVRVDGEMTALSGVFRYEPPPKGVYVAKLTSPSQIAPGVRVRLLRGNIAGIFVESSSHLRLEIAGADGQPFLRLGPDGVSANVRSPTWRASARAPDRRHDVADTHRVTLPEWQRVAAVPRFSWIDPRAQVPQGADDENGFAWRLPMRLGDQDFSVTGETVWRAN